MRFYEAYDFNEMDESLRKSKANYILLIVTVFLRWLGDSFFYAFMARYPKSLPFSPVELGILTMTIPFMGIFGSLALALLGTNPTRRKIFFVILFALESGVVAFFGFPTQFFLVFLFDMIANFCTGPEFSIIDTFIVGVTDQAKKTYGSARQFGTLAYIVGVLSGGYLITYISNQWTFFIGGCIMLFSSILFLFLKYDKNDTELIETQKKPSIRGNLRDLFQNRNFVFFLLGVSLFEAMMLATDTGFSLFSVDLGINDTLFGYAFAAAIALEFIVMMIFQRIYRPTTVKIAIIVGAAAQVLRPILFAIPLQNPNIYLFFDILRGVTMGLCLLAQLILLRRILSPKLLYPGYFLFALVKFVLCAGMDFLIPVLADSAGYTPAFLILAGISLLGLILVLPISMKEKPTSPEAA